MSDEQVITGQSIRDWLSTGSILVVDDFLTMRKLIVNQLKSMGAENVIEAENGAEGLKALNQRDVRLIVTDWNMPIMTGTELTQLARQRQNLRHIPIIMITAEAERQNVLDAIASGVSDIIVKPFTPHQLRQRIIRAISSRNPRASRRTSLTAAEDCSTDFPGNSFERPPHSAPQTVLIVDDSPESLLLISELLSDDYEITVSKSAQEALERCSQGFSPDLMLIDVMMPDMDGITLLERLRTLPNTELSPAILISADTTDQTKLRGLTCGAIDYVEKPISPELLKLRVHNLMHYVRLQRALQEKCDALFESDRLKDQVEQIARHDIKGSIATLTHLAQLVMEADELAPAHRDKLQQIDNIATRTLDLINSSMEIYRIESGRFTLKASKFSIEQELRKAVKMVKQSHESKNLNVHLQVPLEDALHAFADPILTYSALQNLLKNAFEAAPPAGEVNIELSSVEESQLLIRISNTGAVPPEIRESFFDKYATAGKADGSGLGTYSAKLLIEAQQGSIQMQTSDQNNRTTIEITLPKA